VETTGKGHFKEKKHLIFRDRNPSGFHPSKKFKLNFQICVAVSMVCGINIMFTLFLEKRPPGKYQANHGHVNAVLVEDHPRTSFPYHNIVWDYTPRN
jgi:hypothetical protein